MGLNKTTFRIYFVTIWIWAITSATQCPEFSSGFYPNCKCSRKNFDYSVHLNVCFRVCPEDSTGYWPNCTCDNDGYGFSKSEFKCVVCPRGSTGVHPNCDCGELGEYLKNVNNCERELCPTGSSGIIPICTCDDGSTYNGKDCEQCPFGTTGIHPNCTCLDSTAGFDEADCIYCPYGNSTYPNCECEHNEIYLIERNSCWSCPIDGNGTYPDCHCKYPLQYQEINNLCVQCPENTSGTFPNCKCQNGVFEPFNRKCTECVEYEKFVEKYNACVQANPFQNDEAEDVEKVFPPCPKNSFGYYPNCICWKGFFRPYSMECSKCFVEKQKYVEKYDLCIEDISCPENTTGIYPDCICPNGSIKTVNLECMECPEDATGVYPKCQCNQNEHQYSAYINECYVACPENSFGKHPECSCYADETYYDSNEFICKSYIGRKCPEGTIGIGPDCLCVHEDHMFHQYFWTCYPKSEEISLPYEQSCRHDEGKWPQCKISLDPFWSLVGKK